VRASNANQSGDRAPYAELQRGQFDKVLSMLGSRQWAAPALVCGRPRTRRSRSRWNKNLSDGLKW
jgi:hypothetical protein